MKFTITQRVRRLPAALIGIAAAAASVAAAPALIAPASAAALPVQVKKCTPGDITTVNGKKYVCDKYGHWIHVVSLTANPGVAVVGTSSSASVTATVTRTGGFRVLEANNGGGTAVTCGFGSKPGDYMEVRTYTYRNGQRVGFLSATYICGNDGEWHQVAAIASHGGIVSVAGTITAQAVRP